MVLSVIHHIIFICPHDQSLVSTHLSDNEPQRVCTSRSSPRPVWAIGWFRLHVWGQVTWSLPKHSEGSAEVSWWRSSITISPVFRYIAIIIPTIYIYFFLGGGGEVGVVQYWRAGLLAKRLSERSCTTDMIHNKIHLIRLGYPRPSIAQWI